MRVGKEEPVNMYIVKLIRHEWCVCVPHDGLVVCPDYSSFPLTAEVGIFAPVMLVKSNYILSPQVCRTLTF